MSDFDLTSFQKKVEALTDEQLIALVSINAKNYVPEAIVIAQRAVETRGLTPEVQTVTFDVLLNTVGFVGRLILLEEQLMFLSTGLRAAMVGGQGVMGSIATEAADAKQNIAARSMDFSALDNEGSWIYHLDQILDCQATSSLLGGKQLSFEVKEDDGTITKGMYKCNNLSESDFQNLRTQIRNAQEKLKQKMDPS